MSARELEHVPLDVMRALILAMPTKARRFVRELCIRAEKENALLKAATMARDAQDSMAVLDQIHQTIGLAVTTYWGTLPTKERILLGAAAMTKSERMSLLEWMLAEPEEIDKEGMI